MILNRFINSCALIALLNYNVGTATLGDYSDGSGDDVTDANFGDYSGGSGDEDTDEPTAYDVDSCSDLTVSGSQYQRDRHGGYTLLPPSEWCDLAHATYSQNQGPNFLFYTVTFQVWLIGPSKCQDLAGIQADYATASIPRDIPSSVDWEEVNLAENWVLSTGITVECDDGTTRCSSNAYHCHNSSRCLRLPRQCDHVNDCGDNSDEFTCDYYCKDKFRCKSSGRCIPSKLKCDGNFDCLDHSDEAENCKSPGCEVGEYKCSHGACITSQWLCDGSSDCIDAAAETCQTGFRARVTQKALDYASDKTVDFIMSQMPYVDIRYIPTIRSGSADITLSRVKLISFERPQASIAVESYGLSMKIWDLKAHVTASYYMYKEISWFPDASGSGYVDLVIDGMSITIEITIEKDRIGRPTKISSDCLGEGYLDIDFNGDYDSRINEAVSRLSIRSSLVSKICSNLQTAIDEYMDTNSGTIPKNKIVVDLFDFNFAMTRYPELNEMFLETSHTGVTYYLANRVEPPFDPPFIPPFQNDTSKMFYAYISDYVVNAGFYAAYLGGKLSYNVTGELLVQYGPNEVQDFFSPSCQFPKICVGTILPGLPQRYPNGNVEIRVNASKSPTIQFYNGNGILFSAKGNADFFVKEVNETLHIFSVSYSLTLDVVLNVANDNQLYIDVKSIVPDVRVVSSNIGHVGTPAVGLFAVHYRLVELGKKEIKLPIIPSIVQLTDTEIKYINEPGVLVLATDVTVDLPKDLNVIVKLLETLT